MNTRTHKGDEGFPEGWGRNQIRKAKRRALDQANPERRSVRNKIRNGVYPRYFIEKVVTGAGKLRKTELVLKSVFVTLTKEIELPKKQDAA